jgi:hypothetical protein
MSLGRILISPGKTGNFEVDAMKINCHRDIGALFVYPK